MNDEMIASTPAMAIKMRAYLSKSVFENGEISDGSALIAENNLGFEDWTA